MRNHVAAVVTVVTDVKTSNLTYYATLLVRLLIGAIRLETICLIHTKRIELMHAYFSVHFHNLCTSMACNFTDSKLTCGLQLTVTLLLLKQGSH
jgi:hypothetical protein